MSRRKLSPTHVIGWLVCQTSILTLVLVITTCLFCILDCRLFIGHMDDHKNACEEVELLHAVLGLGDENWSVLKPPSVLVLVIKLDLAHNGGCDKQSSRTGLQPQWLIAACFAAYGMGIQEVLKSLFSMIMLNRKWDKNDLEMWGYDVINVFCNLKLKSSMKSASVR